MCVAVCEVVVVGEVRVWLRWLGAWVEIAVWDECDDRAVYVCVCAWVCVSSCVRCRCVCKQCLYVRVCDPWAGSRCVSC